MDRQPRITDFIPHRYSVIALLFLIGLTAAAGLEALHAWMPELASRTADGALAAFDLDGEGGLAAWFSSMTLAAAGLVTLLIYSIRKQRQDDYHGRYRIWLWAALCWMLMSVDEGSSLHEGFAALMVGVTGQTVYGDGAVWWVGPYLLLLGVVGTRLMLDMRGCRGSITSLALAAGCFATAVAAGFNVLRLENADHGVMVEEGCEMLGNLLLLLSMTLHARYVILDAQGLLPVREAKPKAAKKPKAKVVKEETPAKEPVAKKAQAEKAAPTPTRSWFRRPKVDAAHAAPPAPVRRSDLTPAKAPARAPARREEPEEDLSYEYDQAGRKSGANAPRADAPAADGLRRKMSKAERKALRRQSRDTSDDDE